jgi:hypothetical protein
MTMAAIFATKGVVYNPGGGSSPTNKSTSIFVREQMIGTQGLNIGVWTADGTVQRGFTDTTYGSGAQQTTYPIGSAVIFNESRRYLPWSLKNQRSRTCL